jgi:hypothetical protein
MQSLLQGSRMITTIMENKTDVFIVSDSLETEFAEALKDLLHLWELEAFYFTQKKRDAPKGWRQELADTLQHAKAAIVLLSQEFEWSQYCQAEAGAVATFGANFNSHEADKPVHNHTIVITIPPVDPNSIQKVAQVLDGYLVRDASQLSDLSSRDNFFDELASDLNICMDNRGITRSKTHGGQALEANVAIAVEHIVESYDRNVPPKDLMGIWPSIRDETGSAKVSLVNSIKASLDNEKPLTTLSFVGVSLKFSFLYLDEALRVFADEVEDDKKLAAKDKKHPSRDVGGKPKTLKIILVYMDANSHILHSLNAENDLEHIREALNKEFDGTKKTWIEHCKRAHITLEEADIKVRRIDYIPPRVGILIDKEILYAGRCSIQQDDAGGHHLLVGEGEYYYFSKRDGTRADRDRGEARIKEFSNAIQAYSNPIHNGVRLICDSRKKHKWIEELQKCVEHYSNIESVILISNSGAKFVDLIKFAWENGKCVHVHVRELNKAPRWARTKIEGLMEDLREFKRNNNPRGACTFHFCRHPSTFRAALIGDRVVGVNVYGPNSNPQRREPDKSPIRLIASRDSAHYAPMKAMIDDYLKATDMPGAEVVI